MPNFYSKKQKNAFVEGIYTKFFLIYPNAPPKKSAFRERNLEGILYFRRWVVNLYAYEKGLVKMMKLKQRAKQIKSDIPAVFLALKDKETPWLAKIFAAITVVYALSPVDLIPDFVPVLGYLDDLIILPALVTLTIKFIPKDGFAKHRQAAEGMWKNGKPEKWYYGIPFVLVWIVILALIVKMIWF